MGSLLHYALVFLVVALSSDNGQDALAAGPSDAVEQPKGPGLEQRVCAGAYRVVEIRPEKAVEQQEHQRDRDHGDQFGLQQQADDGGGGDGGIGSIHWSSMTRIIRSVGCGQRGPWIQISTPGTPRGCVLLFLKTHGRRENPMRAPNCAVFQCRLPRGLDRYLAPA